MREAEPRRSRFARGNCTESKLTETDQYRSKSVHSPRHLDCGLTQQFAPQALTRVGQVTPARGAATLSDFRNETMHSKDLHRGVQKSSYSPIRIGLAGTLQTESLLDTQAARDRNRRATLSPHLQRKLTVLEKLQAKF